MCTYHLITKPAAIREVRPSPRSWRGSYKPYSLIRTRYTIMCSYHLGISVSALFTACPIRFRAWKVQVTGVIQCRERKYYAIMIFSYYVVNGRDHVGDRHGRSRTKQNVGIQSAVPTVICALSGFLKSGWIMDERPIGTRALRDHCLHAAVTAAWESADSTKSARLISTRTRDDA